MFKQAFERLAFWLDDAFEIPILKKRIGLDPIIGLIPGIGEILTIMFSMVPVYFALKEGAPLRIILRMLINAAIDTTLGLIPVVGDIFDFMFKSNRRNYRLYTDWQKNPGKITRQTTVGFILVLVIMTAIMMAILALAIWLVKMIDD